MSKRIQLGLMVLICVASGWIAGQITTTQALAEPAGNSSSATSADRFDLQSVYIGDSWETWRIDHNSGDAWHEATNELVKIKEPKPVPPGNYDVALITNGKFYLAHRIDRKSGRVWRVVGEEWVELTPRK